MLFALMWHSTLSTIMQLPVGMELMLYGVDVVVRHHKLCDVFLSYCHIAELEAGRCLTRGLGHTHLADVLVRDWARLMYVSVHVCVIFVCSFVSPVSSTQVGIWASRSDYRLELDLSR